MGSHDEFDDFFGDDDDAPVVDTRADGRLLRLPLARLSPNLVNPRTEFGTEDELIDFGKSLQRRQNQACPVVSRGAYLKLWPDHSESIGSVDYVLVSGERRYRGANAVGLAALNCVVNDDFAADRRTFMEAVVSENVDRQNFDPIEEAYAVDALVREFGTNRAVAQHFERADGWVTQRILLTYLDPEIQRLVRTRSMPVEFGRKLGKLARDGEWSAAQQFEWWEEQQGLRKAASEQKKAQRAEQRKQSRPPATAATPDAKPTEDASGSSSANSGDEQLANTSDLRSDTSSARDSEEQPSRQPEEGPSFTAVKPSSSPDGRQEQGPLPSRPAPTPEPVAVVMPWGNWPAVLQILRERMEPADLEQLAKEVLG
ncbi:ParB/RepB/Spo0J family partition protein [Streptomyces hygroscopicus]|nr:hypothetical protein [Streptomyces hygroscopicus]